MAIKEERKYTITKLVTSIAGFLNERINKYTIAKRRNGFLVLGVLIGFVCGYLIVQSVGNDRIPSLMNIDSITTPQDITKGCPPMDQISLKKEYQNVLKFKQMLDSIKSNENQYAIYDSIIRIRPGLEDSIDFFLEYFQSHYSN